MHSSEIKDDGIRRGPCPSHEAGASAPGHDFNAGLRSPTDDGHDLLGRPRQDDGGGQLPPVSQGRAAVLAECVRPVPRRNRRAGPDAARPEASGELREIHVHDDRNTGVVFKANDRSCAAQIVQRVRFAGRCRIAVKVEPDRDPIFGEFDEVFRIAFDRL